MQHGALPSQVGAADSEPPIPAVVRPARPWFAAAGSATREVGGRSVEVEVEGRSALGGHVARGDVSAGGNPASTGQL